MFCIQHLNLSKVQSGLDLKMFAVIAAKAEGILIIITLIFGLSFYFNEQQHIKKKKL